MASLTWWTWVRVSSRSWWWTGKPGVLQTMWSQKVRHDWVTELNWADWWGTHYSALITSQNQCFMEKGQHALLEVWKAGATLKNKRRQKSRGIFCFHGSQELKKSNGKIPQSLISSPHFKKFLQHVFLKWVKMERASSDEQRASRIGKWQLWRPQAAQWVSRTHHEGEGGKSQREAWASSSFAFLRFVDIFYNSLRIYSKMW